MKGSRKQKNCTSFLIRDIIGDAKNTTDELDNITRNRKSKASFMFCFLYSNSDQI